MTAPRRALYLSALTAWFVVCASASATAASAQAAAQAGAEAKDGAQAKAWTPGEAVHVVDVEVRGLVRLDKAAALSGAKVRGGATATPADIDADLRRIWQTGFFADVRAFVRPTPAGGVLVWQVAEKPSIRKISYFGNDAVGDDDLRGATDVKTHTILNTDAVRRSEAKLRDLYVGKGYYLAAVRHEVRPIMGSNNEVEVVFVLEEHDKVVVRDITFLGNHNVAAEDLRAFMQTRIGHELGFLTQAGTFKEEHLQTDVLRLQSLYYDRGYVTVKIGEPKAAISPDRRSIYITIAIEEGEQYRVGNIRYTGDVALAAEPNRKQGPIDEEVLRRHTSLRKGEIFSRTKLFGDMQVLTDLYRDRSYAYANVVPNSTVDPDTRTVDLVLEIERNEAVTIGRIEMSGNGRTRDKVIRRELAIVEGEPYSAAAINLSQARVFQLGYFETVNLNQTQGSHPGEMHVTVEVKEKSTGTFQIGAGFSSVENLLFTAQISQNNWLGNGQSLSLSAQLSFGDFARQLANLQFFEPYLFDTRWSFGFNGYLQQRFYRDFQRNARGFSPSLGYPLTHDLRLSAGYTLEKVDIKTSSQSVEAALYNLNRAGRASSLNGTLAYDTRDNRLSPRRGMFHEARFEYSSPHIGSDLSMAFKRTELGMRFYQPVALGIVARINMQFGWIFGSPGGSVPISERYFLGGIYSVRGFMPRALGPNLRVAGDVTDPGSATREFGIGGNKQLYGNFELEFPLIPAAQVRGVVFADAGNAYDDDEGLFYVATPKSSRQNGYLMGSRRPIHLPIGLYYSFGFGVRWFSPIGPLRFEWGIPITKVNKNDRDVVFEFTIGNFF